MVLTKYAKILAVLAGVGVCSPAFAENPITQTYYGPDPAPVVYGDTVCVYTGNDLGGTFYTMHGWRVTCSTDMVNWTDRSTLILSHADFNGKAKENGDWASQAIRRNGKYYYYVTVESALSPGGRAIDVAVADRPEGPFKDALDKQHHLAGPNWDYIDPTVWIDDDGQAYLYFGNPKLYYAKLKENMVELDGEIKVTDMSRGFSASGASAYTEGPWIHKHKNKYYMIYASHVSEGSEKISYSTSDSPTGPWTWGGIIMDTKNNWNAYTNHSGIIEFKGRSFFFYHNQALPRGGAFSRSAAVEEFTWGSDGSIPTLTMSETGVVKPIRDLDPYQRVEAETKAKVGGITVDESTGYFIIKNVAKESDNVYLTAMSSGFYTKVRSVDMDAGADRIVVCTRGNAGKLELHTESTTGPVLVSMDIPASSKWQENTFELSGASGVEDLYFVVKSGTFDFDYWYMETDRAPVVQTPYKGAAATIPGKIEAENYDVGGHNKSFYDNDRENQGGAYRQDEVDIVGFGCSDKDNTEDCNGYAIGYTNEGEWLEYTVNVTADAKYDITANVATAMKDVASFQLFIDDKAITESIPVDSIAETWEVYKEMDLGSVELKKGTYVLKLLITGGYLNVDWVKFTNPNAPAEDGKKDSSSQDKNGKDSKNNSDKSQSLVALDGFGLSQSVAYYDVFSLSGKRLGRIDSRSFSSRDLSLALKQSGFANGIYFVRSRVRGGFLMQKVIVNGK